MREDESDGSLEAAHVCLRNGVTQMCCAVLGNDRLFLLEVRSLPTLCNSFQQGGATFAANLVESQSCLSLTLCLCVPFML